MLQVCIDAAYVYICIHTYVESTVVCV